MKHISPELAVDFKSTFLSCEKDQEAIWKKLFLQNEPYSEYLKRLLIINNPDCLDMENQSYREQVKKYHLHDLINKDYLRVVPKFKLKEHEDMKSYILLEFDDFMPSKNPEFRNSVITFSIICHLDAWKLDDYKLRPYQIAGYIDGIMDRTKLSGIGTLQFLGSSEFVLNEHLGGIMLRYVATHSTDDKGRLADD